MRLRLNRYSVFFNYHSIATILLLTVSFFWGFTFTITKSALDFMDPYYFIAYRFLFSALTMVFFIKDWSIFFSKRFLKIASLLGLFNFLTFLFQTVGLQYTIVTNSAFIATSYVLFVPFLGYIFFKQKATKNVVFAVIMGLAGLIFLLKGDFSHINIGDLLSFGCAISYSAHILYTGKATKEFPALHLTFFQVSMVSVLSFILVPTGSMQMTWNFDTVSALLFTAVICTTFAFLMQTKLQRVVQPTTTAIIFSTEPVFATITAAVIGHEILSLSQYAGCAIMVLAVVVSQWKTRASKQ